MRVLRHYQDMPESVRRSVAAIGNFDGLHLGHQAVVGEAGRLAEAEGVPWSLITFEPHPYSVFHAGTAPFRLTPFRIKVSLLTELGLDAAFVLPFEPWLYRKTADEFITDVLCDSLGLSHIVIGADFVFGRNRGGDAGLMAEYAKRLGFGLTCLEKVADDGGHPYSSTKVRQYLGAGQPHLAAELLGRAWAIEGRVETGRKLGRTIGFATANLGLDEFLVPALGVYAVRAGIVRDDGVEWRPAVANLGYRPTVGGEGLVLEVHIFEFEEDIYGQYLRVAFIDHLRAEKKFDGIDDLRAQIARDAEQARAILAADATPLEIGTRPPPSIVAKRIV